MPGQSTKLPSSIHFRATGIVPLSHTLSIQPSMGLSSWMLKGSIPTSGLNSRGSYFHRTPQHPVRPPVDPRFPMVSSTTSDASMFQTPAISDYMFSSNCMPPLAGHFGQTKTLHQVCMQYCWSGLPVYARTTENCAPLVPVPNLCATNPTSFSSNFLFLRSLGIPYP